MKYIKYTPSNEINIGGILKLTFKNNVNFILLIINFIVNIFIGVFSFDYVMLSFIGTHDYPWEVAYFISFFYNKFIIGIGILFWIAHFWVQYPIYHVVR